jgi:PST family polysaccharide transporter
MAVGVIWTHTGFLAVKIIGFLSTIVLARLLIPEDFGLLAIGLIVVAFFENLTEVGASAAVVWYKGEPHRVAGVALAVTLISATIVGIAIYFAAPLIADYFEEPRAVGILRVLCASLILSGPALVLSGLLQRRLAFKQRVVPEIAKAFTKGLVGIGLAVGGFGAWSLVFGHVAGLAAALLLIWALSDWRPTLSLDRTIFRAILPYGLQITLIGFIGMAVKSVDYLIIGRFFDARELGIYFLAFSIVDQLVMGICWAASQVLFPMFSSIGHTGVLHDAYKESLAGIAAIVIPVALGIAVIADPLVAVTFGPKWQEAVPVMKAIAIYAIIYSFGFNLGDIYKAIGKPHILVFVGIAMLLVAVPLLTIFTRWGLLGVALGQICVAASFTGLNWIVAARVLGIGPSIYWCALKGPVFAGVVMVSCCAIMSVMAPESYVPRIALIVVTGLISYGLALNIAAPHLVRAAMAFPIASKRDRTLGAGGSSVLDASIENSDQRP